MSEPLISANMSADADLFGPDPASDPLAYYALQDRGADVFAASDPAIGKAWRRFAAGLAAQSHGDLAALQPMLDSQVDDLGLAFRLTGDEQERPWPLNPMPIFIGAAEWQTLTDGLVQRANLLERVIADIYGNQTLIREGHLPAAVVSGSGNFARRMVGQMPTVGNFLQVYAVDLVRGPSGEWRVLSDRVRLPVGIGYALQNRLALAQVTGGLLASVGVRQQTGFFDALRQGIASHCRRSDPQIALLTPGRFNQSYPEQAHLARKLGFALVEGRDLTVREGRLFVRTIAGLKRIHAVWRWINTRDIDPMSFDARSQIGVPNLIAAASEGLVLANWPGGAVVESRAMPAFLPRLARVLLNEELALPNAATWWCGGEQERAHVLANLDQLVISSAFRRAVVGLADGRTRAGASLSALERSELVEAIARRPIDYTAQEIVNLSTTPTLAQGQFEARGFTVRAFLARDENGQWTALQGGFARVSQQGDLRTSLMGMGDISADLCIVDPTAPEPQEAIPTPEFVSIRREQGLLSSQSADNLFWLGRYGERAHQVARIVRALLSEFSTAEQSPAAQTTTRKLSQLLRQLGAAPKPSANWSFARIAETALASAEQIGSVRSLLKRELQTAQLLRDRLTRDSWRSLQRTMPSYLPGDIESIRAACDRLIERRATLAWLFADGMSRGPAWRFLDLGLKLERGSIILQAVQQIVPGSASAADLSALLDLVDGEASYRGRYLTMPFIAPVFDMVLLDPAHPRGLAYQLVEIEQHLAAIPPLVDDG
ncbi:MAG: circularly permuted type 2 ATP-grasp protein, partial [Pseudomonadota bacterium]